MTKSVQNFWTFSGHFQCKSKNVQKSGQIQKFWTRWALCFLFNSNLMTDIIQLDFLKDCTLVCSFL